MYGQGPQIHGSMAVHLYAGLLKDNLLMLHIIFNITLQNPLIIAHLFILICQQPILKFRNYYCRVQLESLSLKLTKSGLLARCFN